MNYIVVDTRILYTKSMKFDRRHSGIHPRNIGASLQNENLSRVLKPFAEAFARAVVRGPPKPLLFAPLCKSGRHRSLAVAKLLTVIAKQDDRFNLQRCLDLNEGGIVRGCNSCRDCAWEYDSDTARVEALAHAYQVWQSVLNEEFRKLKLQ